MSPATPRKPRPDRPRVAKPRTDRPSPLRPRRAPDADALSFDEVVSGAFDEAQSQVPEAASESPAEPAKRVLAPEAESPKLHKVLAQAGLGSRLEMEQLIVQGRLSVNGEPAHVGQRIQHGDQIRLDGKPLRVRLEPPAPRVLAYHKPAGEVVTHDDPQNRPTVFRRLPRLHQGKWQSVGRLDLNTEGLLLFTNAGELANRLMHPSFGLQREYAVRVLGAISNEERQRLLDGVQLEDGPAQFQTIEDGGGEGANCWYRVTIGEGRNREVRRLFEAVGHAVSRLIRIRYGAVVLPRGLPRGAWIELGERDVQRLAQAAGVRTPRTRAPREDAAAPATARRRHGPGPKSPPPKASAPRRRDEGSPARGRASGSQPDPMKTSQGYIGHDAVQRQRREGGKGPAKPPRPQGRRPRG
jgi:23S rRNA pseudouridine2605 synthase